MALDYFFGLSFQRRRMEKDSSRWVDLKYQKIKQKKKTLLGLQQRSSKKYTIVWPVSD